MRVKSKAGCTRYKMSSAGAQCDQVQAYMLCMIAQTSRSTKQPKRPRRADRTQTCRQSSVTPMMATDIIARWSYRNIPTFAAAHHQAFEGKPNCRRTSPAFQSYAKSSPESQIKDGTRIVRTAADHYGTPGAGKESSTTPVLHVGPLMCNPTRYIFRLKGRGGDWYCRRLLPGETRAVYGAG